MKQVSELKVKIGLIKGENKVKLVMAKNEEVGRQLDLMTKNSEGKSRALEELVEEIDTLLREVHEPPSLVDLAAGRVAEEGLGLGEIPTTLKEKVERLQGERLERAVKALINILSTKIHIQTVAVDV